MTANQIILLFDIYRGYNRELHTGTLAKDLETLTARGLTRESHTGFGFVLTRSGDYLCGILKGVSSLKN